MAWRLHPKRVRQALWGVLGGVGTYALLGFLVLPPVLKTQLPKRLGRLLHREVSLERVRTNPFALSITLDGLRVQDRDGHPFLGWDRLYVNVDAATLFSRTLSFSAIHLTRPYGRIVLGRDGRLNCSDLLETQAEPPQPVTPSRSLRIGSLRIQGAQLDLLDQGPAQPFATTLGPLSLALDGFRTTVGSSSRYAFAGRTEAGERFSWEGFLSASPLASQGQLKVEHLALPKYRPYYRDRVNFDLREGSATLAASYAFAWTPGHHVLKVSEGSLLLAGLKLAQTGSADPLVELPAVEARGIEADLLDRTLAIASLHLEKGRLKVVRLRDGSLDLQKLLTPKPQPAAPEPAQPFRVLLRELGLSGFQASFVDEAAARPVKVDLKDLDLTLRDFTLDPKGTSTLALSVTINDTAKLALDGSVRPLAPAAELAVKLQKLAVARFDPYLEPALNARITSGTLSLDGQVRFALPPGAASYSGQVRMENLEVMDSIRSEAFLRYQDLHLKGLALSTQPQQITLQEADLVGPEYRLVIAEDGTSNVARALKLAMPPPPAALGTALGAALPPTTAPTYHVNLQKVRMRQGRLTFLDRSVEPHAALVLSELAGTNTGLSTAPEGQSQLLITGRAGEMGTIRVEGRAMPLRHDKDTDIAVQIVGANLTDFSPYAGKYLGYAIREGKLDVQARVRIQDRKLEVQDRTRLDHFYLGDAVASPEATHLPVKLGLALLRDRQGLIDLEVPADGSLDDPNIHYGRMVWHAILNALGKVVASPFTLVSKLYGAGADLSAATFPPGASVLSPEEAAKLDKLVQALHERPELRLEVEGTTEPETDGAALRQAALERLLCQVQQDRSPKPPSLPKEALPLTAAQRKDCLLIAYQRAFPDAKGTKTPPLPLADQEQRLLSTLALAPQALRDLADARTRTAVGLLLQDPRVAATRIFVVQGSPAAKAGGSRVAFTLK